MILVKNLGKQYGEQVLFEGINFAINPQERIGIVGRNGHGKSTLFKMIAGVENLDEGEVSIPRHYKVGYLDQHINFSHNTILAEGCSALPEDEPEGKWRVEKILSGLGFAITDFERHPNEFSGGFQMRLNLAKVLVSQPNLLMLDEPTNFLDIVTIRWLTRFLKRWPGEIMLISHDRTFMDSIVTQVLGIHRENVLKIKGITEQYYAKILENEEIHEKSRVNLEKKKKQAQEYIDRFRAKASKATQIQSRIKAVRKMGSIDKLRAVKDLAFKFTEAPATPQYCLEVNDITFGYEDGPTLIKDFRIIIANTDRIGVIGKNGQGKTTLMNLLSKDLQPQSGHIKYHPQCQVGHFVQANVTQLRSGMTILDEILDARGDGDTGQARRTCGQMMFTKKTALKTISVLSGGEKSRVILGRLLGTQANLLLLDEPTHHLDMQSSQAMINAVDQFSGATVIVTHDEHFLRSVANRLIVFTGDDIKLYEGGYDSFLADIGWGDDATPKTPPQGLAKPEETPQLKPKDAKRKQRELEKKQKKEEAKQAAQAEERRLTLTPIEARVTEAEAKLAKAQASYGKKEAKLVQLKKKDKHFEVIDLEKDMSQTVKGIKKLTNNLDNAKGELERAIKKFEE